MQYTGSPVPLITTEYDISTLGVIYTIWCPKFNQIRITFGLWKSCEYEYECIRFWKIQIQILSEYEYEYHYSVSTIWILFEYRIIHSPLVRIQAGPKDQKLEVGARREKLSIDYRTHSNQFSRLRALPDFDCFYICPRWGSCAKSLSCETFVFMEDRSLAAANVKAATRYEKGEWRQYEGKEEKREKVEKCRILWILCNGKLWIFCN